MLEVTVCFPTQGWKSYLNDLEQSGMIKSGIIANTEGGKAACTLEYVENNSENDRLTAVLDNKDVRASITYKQMIDHFIFTQ